MKIKRLIAGVMASVMVFSLVSCGNKEDSGDDGCIYGKVDSVSGNDIVLLVAEYSSKASSDESGEDSAKASDSSGSGKSGRTRPQNGEMPEGFDPSQFRSRSKDSSDSKSDDSSGSSKSGRTRPQNGEMPEDFDPSRFGGDMPEGFDPSQFRSRSKDSSDSKSDDSSGSSKSGRTRPQNGEMPEDFDPSRFGGDMPEGFSRSGSSKQTVTAGDNIYTLTGEQKELRIPVGVTVTTSKGVKTNFDALSKGDIIKCRIEKDSDGNETVTEVWIMEQ